MRRLVADAAVLGTTFPAEALIAVSGQDESAVRAALAELVRREVLTVSADPLSPERGSYGFAQQMLRQVAYDTLSRRDRKTRHLAVAAHLRAAFPGDGEEVAEVIARHYLDALEAVPDDPDAGQIRGQAIEALVRAAERAERTGAPARAAASYAARRRTDPARRRRTADAADGRPSAGMLWERAARAADTSADWAMAVEHAGRAREYYLQRGQARAAARAQAIAGQALRRWGRHARGARAAHRRGGGAAGRSRHRHGARPGPAGGGGGIRRVARGRPAHHRGADPRPGPRRRTPASSTTCSSPAGSTSTTPGDTPKRSPTSAKARGWPARPATTSAWDGSCSTWRMLWRLPIPRRPRRPPGQPPGICAGPATGTSWPMRSPTWSRRC